MREEEDEIVYRKKKRKGTSHQTHTKTCYVKDKRGVLHLQDGERVCRKVKGKNGKKRKVCECVVKNPREKLLFRKKETRWR
jgi:hypothetical protein